ncbi:MAG: hypothetical protein ACE15F_09155 [bacterium]
MKRLFWLWMALGAAVMTGWTAPSVTVNQSGAGDFKTIQEAVNSGATLITITDSANYVENVEIGDPDTGGPAVTLTSNQTGDQRPVITPAAVKTYDEVHRSGTDRGAGFGLFANNSVISNLIIEGHPDLDTGSGLGLGALFVMADNVVIQNCLFRPHAGTAHFIEFPNTLLFFAQQGTGGVTVSGGRDCNGCVVRDCEFTGVATDAAVVEPTIDAPGYLERKGDKDGGYAQSAGYTRMDHYSDGRDVTISFENCYFHHNWDYGIFPSNRGTGGGSLNILVKGCRFDANGKFAIRSRGANVNVECCVFTRVCQGRRGDDRNAAVSIMKQDSHSCSAQVKNCLFVNCGSANYQQGYMGGVNNSDADAMTVDHCTFVSCLNGACAGEADRGAGANYQTGFASISISNSIFHQIGYNTPPAVDMDGITLTADHPDLQNGLYPAWDFGQANFGTNKWSAVFNRFHDNDAMIMINNCLVGDIASEDSRPWDEALADDITGCRLYCGFDYNFEGAATVTRGTPVFVNTDPDAPNPFELAANSPGQGMGADFSTCRGTTITNWSVFE